MAQIVAAGSLNVPALGADDAYIQIVNPPSFVSGVPTDVIGVVGTASWGPVGIPQHLGSGQDAVNTFGPISTASLNDQYDMATDLFLAFGQSASQATLEAWATRISDGTDVAASGSLTGAASPTGKTITVGGTITANDTCTVTVTASGIAGGSASATYTVKAGDTVALVAAGLAAALNLNGALLAAGVSATSASAVVNIYAPSALTITVGGTTSVSASETLTAGTGSTTTAGMTFQSLYTGILGNSLKVTVATGTKASSFTVTVTPPVGLPEVYPNIASATFWRDLATAINLGLSTVRGQSQCIKAVAVTPAVGAPNTTVLTLSGGTDGRAGVTSATLLGNSTATPQTGIWSLTGLQPAVGIAWMTGVTDLTVASTLLSFAQTAGVSALISLPTGLTTIAAAAAWQAAGVADPSIAPVKDFISFFDPVNNITRRVPPTAVIGGRWATLGPEQSPGNKPVNLVVGTERNDPVLGNQQYTTSEVAQLEAVGIMLITNPIPRGRVFGIRHGQTSALDPVTKPAEYWRMTMYLARSAASFIGKYIGELQSQDSQDPVRAAFRLESNQFLQSLVGAGQIDRYQVTCTYSASLSATPGNGMNTQASVASHYMFALWQVTYLSSIRFLVLSLQGGTTVVEVAGQLTQQPANF